MTLLMSSLCLDLRQRLLTVRYADLRAWNVYQAGWLDGVLFPCLFFAAIRSDIAGVGGSDLHSMDAFLQAYLPSGQAQACCQKGTMGFKNVAFPLGRVVNWFCCELALSGLPPPRELSPGQ